MALDQGFVNNSEVSTSESYFGRYLHLGSKAKGVWARVWFGVDYNRWRKNEGCPLWIEIQYGGKVSVQEAEEKLGYWYGWIDIPTGKEYGDVLDSVVDDLRNTQEGLLERWMMTSGKILPGVWLTAPPARSRCSQPSALSHHRGQFAHTDAFHLARDRKALLAGVDHKGAGGR